MPDIKSKQKNTENVYLEFQELHSAVGERIYGIFNDMKYRDNRFKALFTSMLIRDLKGEAVTLEDMLEFMSESSSKSTRLRLIEHARRDGYIVSIRKTDLNAPEDLNATNAKKAFFMSDELRTAILRELDKSIYDFVGFAERNSSELGIHL